MCFPPNCTALLQPMDQNIINLTKANYKKSLLAHLVATCGNNMDLAIKALNLKHAVSFLANAWDSITETSVKNCWKILIQPRFDGWDSDDDLPLSAIRDDMQNHRTEMENMQTLLLEFSPTEQISTTEIVDWIGETNLGGSNPISSSEESTDTDDFVLESVIKASIKLDDVIKSFTICLDWAQENNASLNELMTLQKLRENVVLRRNVCLKQTSLKDFFKAN